VEELDVHAAAERKKRGSNGEFCEGRNGYHRRQRYLFLRKVFNTLGRRLPRTVLWLYPTVLKRQGKGCKGKKTAGGQ
jgi:hypothetical protein